MVRIRQVPSPAEITGLLRAWSDGDSNAFEALVPLVEAELRRLARVYMARERRDHTLQATALVNEAFVRLIYVQPFPAIPGVKHQLLPRGGQPKHPVWSADTKHIFYNPGPGQFESVSVTTLPNFAFGNPVAMPRPFPGAPPGVRRPYDITPDGRFVSAIAAGQSASGRPTAPQIQVVLNWFEELKTRAPLTR